MFYTRVRLKVVRSYLQFCAMRHDVKRTKYRMRDGSRLNAIGDRVRHRNKRHNQRQVTLLQSLRAARRAQFVEIPLFWDGDEALELSRTASNG